MTQGLRALAAAGFAASVGIQALGLAGIGTPRALALAGSALLLMNMALVLASMIAAPWKSYKVFGSFYHRSVDVPEMARRSARWVRWVLVLSGAYCILFLLALALFPVLRIFAVGFPPLLMPQFALIFLVFNGTLAPKPKRKPPHMASWWEDWLHAWRSD